MNLNPEEYIYCDVAIIIFNGLEGLQAVKEYFVDEKSSSVTLNMLMEKAKENGYRFGVITVIAETPLSGKIYQYGNYGDYWVMKGETIGFA